MEENTPNTGSKLKGTLGGQPAGTDSMKEPVSWDAEPVSWTPEPAVKNPEPAVTNPKPAYNFDPKTGRPVNSEVRNPAVTLYGPPPTDRISQPSYNFDPKTGRPVNPVNPVNPVYPAYPEEPAKKKKTGLIIGLIAGGVVLIAAVVLILVFVGRKKELNPAEFAARCREIGFQEIKSTTAVSELGLSLYTPEVTYAAGELESANNRGYDGGAYYLSFSTEEQAKGCYSYYNAMLRQYVNSGYGSGGVFSENSGKNWEKAMGSDNEMFGAVMRIGKTLILIDMENDSSSEEGFQEFCEQLLNELTK